MFDQYIRLLLCAVAIGGLIRVLRIAWRRWFLLEVPAKQAAIAGGGLAGLIAGFRLYVDYRIAAATIVLVIGGFFLVHLLYAAQRKEARRS